MSLSEELNNELNVRFLEYYQENIRQELLDDGRSVVTFSPRQSVFSTGLMEFLESQGFYCVKTKNSCRCGHRCSDYDAPCNYPDYPCDYNPVICRWQCENPRCVGSTLTVARRQEFSNQVLDDDQESEQEQEERYSEYGTLSD